MTIVPQAIFAWASGLHHRAWADRGRWMAAAPALSPPGTEQAPSSHLLPNSGGKLWLGAPRWKQALNSNSTQPMRPPKKESASMACKRSGVRAPPSPPGPRNPLRFLDFPGSQPLHDTSPTGSRLQPYGQLGVTNTITSTGRPSSETRATLTSFRPCSRSPSRRMVSTTVENS